VIIVVVSLVREGAHARLIYGALALLIASFGLAAGVWLSWLFLTALAAGGVIRGVFKWPESPSTSIILINGIIAGSPACSTREALRAPGASPGPQVVS
jgi:hypothetical protein